VTSLLQRKGLKKPFGGALAIRNDCFEFATAGRGPKLSLDSQTIVGAILGLRRQRRDPLDRIDFHKTSAAARTISRGCIERHASHSAFKHLEPVSAGREEEGR